MEEFKIVCIGINRPAKRNCVNKVTAEKLYDAFSDFENDDNLNCAVLHGKYLRNHLKNQIQMPNKRAAYLFRTFCYFKRERQRDLFPFEITKCPE